MIQKADSVEPTATIRAENQCTPFETRFAAEEVEPEEAGLEEEGEDALGGERRAEDVADELGILRPVRAELEFHHDAGGDADGERQPEHLAEELADADIDLVLVPPSEPLDDHQQPGEADRDGREEEMEPDRHRELQPGEEQCIHAGPP